MKKKILFIILLASVFVYRNYAQEDEIEPSEEVEIGSSGLDLSPPDEVVAPPEAAAPSEEAVPEATPTEPEAVSESPSETTPGTESTPEETPQEIPHE